ncbi:endonuclease domain-containing 1 protein-like [Clarias gariepinus]|uniref:endonuclease domain-containing 1 protein-like n=1 Tax=Clarias gariepinus TaxID=13013 RepID=UPI00234D691D|nr:endonuclease domain-containing 1 protein-like [Clarias gariepinus]
MKLVALVLLLSAFSSMTLTEVVENINEWKSKCHDFFIPNPKDQNDVITPTVFNTHKKICQSWKNKYRFATLYDTERKIPVYSAYTFAQEVETKRKNFWKYEPQLENISDQKDMKNFPRNRTTNLIHQATNSDYTNSGYTRGHVFPRFYAADQEQADSTFTLTNIAPQKEQSNTEWERQVERPMQKEIINSCKPDQKRKAYIVTGVVPGNNWTPTEKQNKKDKKKINIPSHFWSAFSCRDINENLISAAYIAEQDKFERKKMSVMELNNNLTNLYKINFYVFGELNF